ncbi:hypothetical protein G9A89_012751 [Geosiphon pyriformis]|nr:hypothetical protein G9A89_012751 [Geosiphon pyriformis]
MDGLLKNAGTADVTGGAAAYFSSMNLNVGVRVYGLLSSTLSELQAVALALECVTSSCTVVLYLDSQAAIDVCVSKISLAVSDFCVPCWIERRYIFNFVRDKDLAISWIKVKDHSEIVGNVKVNAAAGYTTCFKFFLPVGVHECFLVAKNTVMSGNAHHFAGPGQDVVPSNLVGCVDWNVMAKVWHPDSHMLAGFTSRKFSGLCTYLMKAVHQWLPVVIRKKLYNRKYSGILCLLCSEVKVPNYVFTCVLDAGVRKKILAKAFASWISLLGVVSMASFAVLWDLG